MSGLISLPVHGQVSPAPSEAKLQAIAQGRYWRLLLHYMPQVFGSTRGSSLPGDFYFSPDGRYNPLAELKATLLAFTGNSQVGPLKLHPQCAFPERFRYLKQELNLNIPARDCPDFRQWINGFRAKSITLVYAANFMANAASIFGHTFLRVDHESGDPLLSYGISYAANALGSNPFLYAIRGLFGGFRGVYSLQPYFEKVNEYRDNEDRDMWEYKLTLTKEEITRALTHFWELGTTVTPYYFFNHNCSLDILHLLEVGRPSLRFLDQAYVWVTPAETVQWAQETPGLVGEVTFRPSLYKKLKQRLASLDTAETARLYELDRTPANIQSTESTAVLDTLLDLWQYRMFRRGKELNQEEQTNQRKVLLVRSKLPNDPRVLPEISRRSRPDEGQKQRRFTAAYKNFDDQSLWTLDFRAAYHDLLDNDQGFSPFSELEMFRGSLAYLPDKEIVKIHDIHLVTVTTLLPIERFRWNWSWAVKVGAYTPRDFVCELCAVPSGSAAGGISLALSRFGLWYVLAKANLDLDRKFTRGYRAGPSLLSGVIMEFDRLKFALDWESLTYMEQAARFADFQKISASLNWVPSKKHFQYGLRASYEIYTQLDRDLHEATIALSRHF